jgi:hypothetical protein
LHPDLIVAVMRDLVETALAALALGYVALYVVVAASRMGYPFQLEWMEGAVLQGVRRVVAGEAVYVQPSLEYVPLIYPPLYFYAAAPLTALFPDGFLPLRLLSFVASISSLWVLFLYVRRDSGSRLSGLLASGLFAATFARSGGWFDLARVDSLFVALLLCSAYLLRGSSLRVVLAGVVLALAGLAKQTAFLVALPVAIYELWKKPSRGMLFLASAAAASGGAALWLNRLSGGWYARFVFELPLGHTLVPERLAGFWIGDILAPFSIVILLGVCLGSFPEPKGKRDPSRPVWVWGLLFCSWVGRMNRGGGVNTLIPAHAGLAMLFGLSVARGLRLAEGLREEIREGARRGILVGCALQLGVLLYDPTRFVPKAVDYAAGQRLVALVRELPGEVFLPYDGYLAVLAGKRALAHGVAIRELQGHFGGRQRRVEVEEELRQALASRRFAAVLASRDSKWLRAEIERYYVPRPPILPEGVFYPVTGKRIRPDLLYEPRPPGAF